MPSSNQPKMRLKVVVTAQQHDALARKARKQGATLANYMRGVLGLPPRIHRERVDMRTA